MGVELLFNSVEFGVPKQLPVEFQTVETRSGREGHTRPRGHSENPRCSCQQTPRGLETRCGREGHTRPRGPSESPDGVDPNIRRTIKTQRDGHNSGVKIWSLCSVSSILSHATLKQPFRTLAIKWEVNIFVKKSSCVVPSCVFLLASLLLWCWRCICIQIYIWKKIMDSNPTIREEKLTNNPNRKWGFIEKLYIYIYIYI